MKFLFLLLVIIVAPFAQADIDSLAQGWRGFAHPLDASNEVRIEFGFKPAQNGFLFSADLTTKSLRDRQRQDLLPKIIQEGVQVFVNGKLVPFDKEAKETHLNQANISIPMIEVPESFNVEFKFLGLTVGKYEIKKSESAPGSAIKTLVSAKAISRFDMRMMASQKLNSEESKKYIADYIARPRFIELQEHSKDEYFIDLHTHFAGAVSTKSLIKIGQKLELPYPTAILDKMGVRYKEHRVVLINGVRHIPFPGWYDSIFLEKLNIDPVETITFDQMSEMYQLRDPFVKNPAAFKAILEEIAMDYQKMGVKYAELSYYTIVKPEFYKMANEILPELEARYGVKINFLVGLWRHSNEAANKEAIKEMKMAMKQCPAIVGVDFMGHETNPTTDFKEALLELSELKNENPKMALRVHAGENPNHEDNILDAIRYGATRIGHGLYGVTPEVIQMAKQHDVTIEFNFNSNLALQNVEGPKLLAETVRKYMDGGVKVTLGTDGHGLYLTSPASEIATAKAVGITDQNLKKIWNDNRTYQTMMDEWKAQRVSVIKNKKLIDRKQSVEIKIELRTKPSPSVRILRCQHLF